MKPNKESGKKSGPAKAKAVSKKKQPVKSTMSIMEKFTGLTLSEQMKLKKLKKTLAGDNGNSGKQISTQQTITFDKMYHDGICKVKKNYYTKMIEFYDLNYVLLDEDERADILGLYSQFINYFDPSISFQIFLFNRHVNEETLAAQFDISAQGDKFDDIREEFSDMLKNLSAKGNNGVIKSKYIIYGIEAENLKEARQ
ncbi:MAG: conjugal transfer protein TraE, partial [Clostridiales bacterium]|nr:conjugal transfer protein TraE [Clostridiales bacterium]